MTSPLRSTERRNPRSTDLDLLEPSALVALFVAEEARVPVAIEAAQASIAAAMTLIEAAFRRGGRLTYVGAGTSGRLGVLDASECPPTFGTPPAMVQAPNATGARIWRRRARSGCSAARATLWWAATSRA